MEGQPMRAHPTAGFPAREFFFCLRVSKESYKQMIIRDPYQDKAYVTCIWFIMLQLSCL